MSKSRVNLSCTAPKKVADDLQKIASHDDQTVSRVLAKAAAQYVTKERKNGHPALSDEKDKESN